MTLFCFVNLLCSIVMLAKNITHNSTSHVVYFHPPISDVIQETDHRLLTSCNKPIIGFEKTRFLHAWC